LIGLGININIKTFDEWLPIHLAIKQENLAMVSLLVTHPRLNINLCTVHGLALNMAIELPNAKIVEKLLTRDPNLAEKDHLDRTASDVLKQYPNSRISVLL
jgi:ankyrin repeat protein